MIEPTELREMPPGLGLVPRRSYAQGGRTIELSCNHYAGEVLNLKLKLTTKQSVIRASQYSNGSSHVAYIYAVCIV
jgi:hypothetical protein